MVTHLTHIFSFFNFKSCESVALYIILLEVAASCNVFVK